MAPFTQHDEEGAAPAAPSNSELTAHQSRADAPAQGTTPANSIARSMSRYRKRALSTTARAGGQAQEPVPPIQQHDDMHRTRSVAGQAPITPALLPSPSHATAVPPVPTIPLQHAFPQAGSVTNSPTTSASPVGAPYRSPPPRLHERQPIGSNTPSATSSRQTSAEHESRSRSGPGTALHRQRTNSDEARLRRRRHEEESHHVQSPAAVESQPDPAAAKPKKDVTPLQLEMPPIQEQAPQPPKSQRSPVMEKFASLTKVRKPKAATTHAPKLGREAQGHPNDQAVGIVSGGMGIVPQTDAPASAINTADQIVAVRCRGNRFLLDVDADTTIVEIISKCARLVNDREINESSCVVLESYETLGLERRVRSFEAIRDIVNSWDLDSENCLVVRLREAGDSCNEPDSTTTSKSADPPKGCQVYMYHSNRPGKWNKRHITLLDNGQIISSKKQDAHAGDKDSINLCRLSDYDIYQPMESEKRRHLKPPKRHCFAIRSQQKTTVFLNTDNYVQYFSVEDPELASLFQRKVDAWRSWCLLDRRPEPRKQSVASPPRTFNAKDETKSSPGVVGRHTSRRSVNLSDHRPRRSVDESPHATGDFKPLLDLSFSDKRLSLFGANQGGSPRNSKELARPNRDSLIGRGLVDTIKVEDGFTGNGLLGNSYEERREAANQEGTEQVTRQGSQSDSNAFAEGPTLLNKQALADLTSPASNQPNSSTWFPSALEHTAKQSAIRPVTSATPANARQQPPSNEDSRYHKAGRVPGHQAGQYRPRDGYPSAGMGQPQMQRSHESRSVPPQSSRREQPKPLLDLNTPTINEPPQWQRKGHGVKAPSGLEHLVDFITTTDPNHPDARRGLGMLDVPPRNSRRPSPSGAGVSTPPTSGRARSHSLSNTSGNGRAMMAMAGSRAGGAAAPPMPSLPGRSRAAVDDYQRSRSDPMREREQRERERQRRKEQERAYREKEAAFNSVPGRNGTLKVV